MRLHKLELELREPSSDLHPEALARIKANIGIKLRHAGILNDSLIDELGVLANGVWNAATEAAKEIKPLDWLDNNMGNEPTASDRVSYHVRCQTVFAYYYVNYFDGTWRCRVDGKLLGMYDSLEEAKGAAFDDHKEHVAKLLT